MRRARPPLPAAVAVAAGLLLGACTSAAGSTSPTWVPSPAQVGGGEGNGRQLSPILPIPSVGGSSSPTSRPSGGGPGTPSPSGSRVADPNVVATHLSAPVGLTMMPDGTALVGERTTGRIVRVEPVAGQPVRTVRRLTGLSTAGDGGLLDLALSPSYDEDSLIYAYITTPTDNRVVDFTLKGPVTPVITGIPKGRFGNTGRLLFGADGNLFVGTGDAGQPALAERLTSRAGKVLRINPIGDLPAGNPQRNSPVWASGLREVDGLCASPRPDTPIEVEAGVSDEVNVLSAGEDYGYPKHPATSQQPATVLPTTYRSPGGCAVSDGLLYVTSLDGKALLSAPLSSRGTAVSVGRFGTQLTNRYGRLRTVVAASDGALWLTTSNRDGHGSPVPDDERVIRYVPSGSVGSNPA